MKKKNKLIASLSALALTASLFNFSSLALADTLKKSDDAVNEENINYTVGKEGTENEQRDYIRNELQKLEKEPTTIEYYDFSKTNLSKNEQSKLSSEYNSTSEIQPYAEVYPDGTTRVTTYEYPVNPTTYLVETKSTASPVNIIWNIGMYIAGKLAGTFGGFLLDGANLALDSIDKTAGGSVHTFQSYRYTDKNAQAYTASTNSWKTWYVAEKQDIFKHATNTWRSSKYNETNSKTVDYTPSKGFVAHLTNASTNYNSNAVLADRAWTNWYKNSFYYKSPERY